MSKHILEIQHTINNPSYDGRAKRGIAAVKTLPAGTKVIRYDRVEDLGGVEYTQTFYEIPGYLGTFEGTSKLGKLIADHAVEADDNLTTVLASESAGGPTGENIVAREALQALIDNGTITLAQVREVLEEGN
jgi:hypothetical protein